MGDNLLAENWTVTSVPCSFWLIKEILIYCHCNSSVRGANRRAGPGCGDDARHSHRAAKGLPSALGTCGSLSSHRTPIFLGLESTG